MNSKGGPLGSKKLFLTALRHFSYTVGRMEKAADTYKIQLFENAKETNSFN